MSTRTVYRVDEKATDLEPEKRVTPIRIRNQGVTIAIAFFTAILMTFTIFFAWNSSLVNPMLELFVSKSPQRSILILNVASHLTLCALQELTLCVFDAIRWALACQGSGTTALTFITLSRATSFLGSIYLSLGRSEVPDNAPHNDHRVWGAQKVLLALLRIALGVVLLSDVSFRASYRPVHQVSVIQAGLSPLDPSFAHTEMFGSFGTDYFSFYYASLLSDGKVARSVAPISCSDPSCQAFFIPGPTSVIQFDPAQPNITASLLPAASAVIQYDAPGYQIDFSPIDYQNAPPITLEDCHLYGIDGLAMQLCLKDFNGSIIAAWVSCPLEVGYNNMCRNTTDSEWRQNAPFNIKMTVTNRRATTVFNRFNYTILEISDLSKSTPMNYTANDLFGFYDVIMNVNLTQENWQFSSPFGLVKGLANYLLVGQDIELDSGGGSRQLRLQSFLATPFAVFNMAWLHLADDASVMGKTIALAVPGYRLVIAPVTLYMFMVGGLISLLWCLIALPLAMVAMAPKTTFYTEIDFAAKVAVPQSPESYPQNTIYPESFGNALSKLTNASSREIKRGLAGLKLYVRAVKPDKMDPEDVNDEGDRRITIISEDAGSRLSHITVEEAAGSTLDVDRISQRFSRASRTSRTSRTS